jgi:hypothetical protein
MGNRPPRNDERHRLRPSIRKPGCDAEPSRDVVVQRLTRELDRARAQVAALQGVVRTVGAVVQPYAAAATNTKAGPSSLNAKGFNALRLDREVWRTKK